MNFLPLLTNLPFLKIAKYGAILLVVSLIFGSGTYVGMLVESKAKQVEIDKVKGDLKKVDEDFADAKIQWASEKEEMARAAATALAQSQADAKRIEGESQAKIAQINKNWVTNLKRVQDEAQAAIDMVRKPVATDNPVTDGMWVDVTNCQRDDSASSGSNLVPAAPNSFPIGTFRCRLHPQVAERLIESATEANRLVTSYNSCTDSLRILSPQSFATQPEIPTPKP